MIAVSGLSLGGGVFIVRVPPLERGCFLSSIGQAYGSVSVGGSVAEPSGHIAQRCAVTLHGGGTLLIENAHLSGRSLVIQDDVGGSSGITRVVIRHSTLDGATDDAGLFIRLTHGSAEVTISDSTISFPLGITIIAGRTGAGGALSATDSTFRAASATGDGIVMAAPGGMARFSADHFLVTRPPGFPLLFAPDCKADGLVGGLGDGCIPPA